MPGAGGALHSGRRPIRREPAGEAGRAGSGLHRHAWAKGLLGPQGTGLLLCGGEAAPLLFGGTGSESLRRDMPGLLPERLEPGTLNVPGAAGLDAGMRHVLRRREAIAQAEHRQAERCARGLAALGMRVFSGAHQAGTVSFVPEADCERAAELLARRGIALRAGLHCAPLAHESAGTLETGTVRVSFGPDAADWQTDALLAAAARGFAG